MLHAFLTLHSGWQSEMDPYNKKRYIAGFSVDNKIGRTTAELAEKRGKHMIERSKSLLVHMVCMDPHDEIVGNFNGLFYLGGGQDPLVLTIAHMICFNGATKYMAAFYAEDGTTHMLGLALLKAGAEVPGVQPPPAPQAHVYLPDLAVFRVNTSGTDMPMLAPPLPPAVTSIGDKTYIIALTADDHTLSFSEGVVSSVCIDACTTTAYADHGYSGAPVIDMRGHLLGLVVRGVGTAIKLVEFIPPSTYRHSCRLEPRNCMVSQPSRPSSGEHVLHNSHQPCTRNQFNFLIH